MPITKDTFLLLIEEFSELMKILLTGATGYIGQRLIPVLLEKGHEIVCCVRDKSRFNLESFATSKITVVEVDFLNQETLSNVPVEIDIAYYLIHSMSSTTGDFSDMETTSAKNFIESIKSTSAKQIIYLSGIVNEKELSKHLQ